jgi:predicted amidohydrolase YtcJ
MRILYNANLHTLDPHQPKASAIAIEQGRILALGDDGQLLDGAPASAARQDLGGRTVLPGLTDAHLHLEHYALGLQKVNCETDTRTECLQRVAERARQTPPGDWILGHGWNQNAWPEGFGEAADLDAAAPRHPVYLTAKSLHAGWANRLALQAAGVSAAAPDPPGGHIERGPDGAPTGFLFESAMDLVQRTLPDPGPTGVAQAIREALPALWGMGLTGVHDFDQRRCFQALQMLEAAGELRLRVVKSIPLDDLPHAAALGLRSGFGSEWLRIGGVKAFADGALGPRTAAMLAPYDGEPQNRGMLLLDAETLFEHGRIAAENGLSLAVHAIGDRANHEVLDAFAQLRRYESENGLPPLRHRIEHVQLLHPQDAARLAELGVIASMQPIHATSDMRMADRYWGERSRLAYAWRTQLEHGALLAFGSDAPVESPNPFWGLHAALTRRRADGTPGPEGWYPEQRLTLTEALRAYTTGAAYAAGTEDRQGRLAPGCYADLIVLENDPFICEAEEIRELRPLATMVGGEWVLEM